MSYILDALRRADAERARGAVPGLHDQPLAARPVQTRTATRADRLPWQRAMSVAVLLLMGGAAAWWWWRPGTAPALPPASEAPRTEVEPPSTVDRSVLQPQSPVPAPVPEPAVPTATVAATASPQPSDPMGHAAPRPVSPSAAARPLPATKALAAAPAVVEAAPHVTVNPKPAAVPKLAQLSASDRQGLPALKVGGSMYSDSADSRILIVDGQMLHEGATVAPGLVLERIGPHAARLRWHDQAFELPY